MSLYVEIYKQLNHFKLEVTFSSDLESTALFGISGSGKSMILKCIAGIETPDAGKIILNGKVLFDSAKKINLPPQKREVGYLFQNYALFPHLTVRQNIMIARKSDEAKMKELLKRFNLTQFENQLPNQLSGGQQQRVAICRMLAMKPQLLLFDEPFSAIDTYLKDQLHLTMVELIKKVQKDVIIVTHDFKEAYSLCKKMVFIDKGQVLANDLISKLYFQPQNKQLAKLFGYKNIVAVKDNMILDWSYHLKKPICATKLIIPNNAFKLTQNDNQTVSFNSYQIISDFKETEVLFKTDFKDIWVTFTNENWQKWVNKDFYLTIDEDKIIILK